MSAPGPVALTLPPGIEPRAYQSKAVELAREHVRKGRRPVIVAPTGAGKTTMGALIAANAVQRGSRVLWVVHRRELILQAKERLEAFRLDCGLILRDETPNPSAPVQIASIATLVRRELPEARVVIVDECHRGRAKSYERVLEHYMNTGSAILGLTATPARADGKGLAPRFDALVETVKGDELRTAGVLVPARVYAPDLPDLSGVVVRGGEYGEAEAAEAMSALTGSIVETWQRLAPGKRSLAFACTIEHSQGIVAEFLAAGVPAEHIDGSTPSAERAAILERLRAGETLVVSNVGVLVEGLDIPALEAVVLARPTRSLTLYLQSVGRGLRSAPGKSACIVLDHAGNALRFGHPEDERIWRLEGKPTRAEQEERRGARCPDCSRIRPAGERYCDCEYVWPERRRAAIPEHREGSLEEIKRGRPKAPDSEKERTFRYLQAVGEHRGYKPGWAMHRFHAIYGTWPNQRRQPDPQTASRAS